jgi:cardiolipin synthase
MKTHGWVAEKIFSDGNTFFSQLIKDIDRASTKVTLETYIFSDDDLGRSIVRALNRAAQRGVKVRLMVDGVGSAFSSILFLMQCLDPKIKFRVYHPLPWFFIFTPFRRFPSVTRFIEYIFSLNSRNHRKTCIIDGRIALVGGMNISSNQLIWRDTGMRVEGKEVRALNRAFSSTWIRAGFGVPLHGYSKRKSKFRPPLLVRLNDTWALRSRLYRDLLKRLSFAKDKIWITNAYFIPHLGLVKALCEAAQRGVEVKILVPQNCDLFFVPLVRAVYYNELLKSGARVFEYIPTMLHAKTIIIDDWAILGSSNLNHRSLNHDLEADIVMTHDRCKKELGEQFVHDVERSVEITLDHLRERSWMQTSSGQALLLLKNWM